MINSARPSSSRKPEKKTVSFRGRKSGWRGGAGPKIAGRTVSKRFGSVSRLRKARGRRRNRDLTGGEQKSLGLHGGSACIAHAFHLSLSSSSASLASSSSSSSASASPFRGTGRRTIQSTADCKNKRDDAVFSSAHFDLRRGSWGSFYFRRPRKADFQNTRRGRCTVLLDSASRRSPAREPTGALIRPVMFSKRSARMWQISGHCSLGTVKYLFIRNVL